MKCKGKEINRVCRDDCNMDVRTSQFSSWVLNVILILTLSTSVEAICGGDPDTREVFAQGAWGGVGAALKVTENGVFIEFDCAHGHIPRPVIVLEDGRFSAEGSYLREAGGPGRLTEQQPEGSPAVYSGKVNHSRLILLVDLPEEGRSKGPFTLAKYQPAQLEKCL